MKFIARIFPLFLLLWLNAFFAFATTNDGFRKITENGKIGLENTSTNQIVIPPTFDDIGWSNETTDLVIDGVIGFKLNNKWGLINLEGNSVIKEQYTVLYPFTNNLIIAGKRSRSSILFEYGVISSAGKFALELEYQRLEINGDYLLASKKEARQLQMGLLSSSLKTIIPFEYKSIAAINPTLYAVKNERNLAALFDVDKGLKSDFNYESMNALGEQHILVSLKNRKGIIDLEGNTIAAPIYKEIKIVNEKLVGTPFPKWSFLDTKNKTLNSFYFDQVHTLSNTAFAVQTNDKVSIINEEGDYLSYFHDLHIIAVKHGLAVVKRDSYLGVLDQYGNIIVPINQDSIWLDEGFIFTKIKKTDGHSWTPYDHTGKRIGYSDYQEFARINGERLRAKRNEKWGLLNNAGVEVSPFSFDSLGTFNAGYSSVRYLEMYGVIDQNGRWVITPHKDGIEILKNHFLYKFGSEKGLINQSGDIIFRSQSEINPLGEFFTVKNRDDKYILLNQEGNRAILEPVDTIYFAEPSLYVYSNKDQWYMLNGASMRETKLKNNIQQILIMSEGLIMAEIDDYWGFLKENGQLSIANRYDSLQFYSEGLAAVKLIGNWGFIDSNEKIIIQPNFESAAPFNSNLSIIKKDGFYGMINNKGTIVLEIKYDKIEQTKDHILLFKGNLIGLANSNGELQRNIQFSSLEAIDSTYYLVSKNGKYGVISKSGIDIIPTYYDKVITVNGKFLVKETTSVSNIVIK